jgi:hypothetical protein
MRAMTARWRAIPAIFALLLVASCNRAGSNAAPERVATPFSLPAEASMIAVPVTARVADLERLLNARVPMSFDSSAAQQTACADTGGKASALSRIGCQFSGRVTRGPIAVSAVDANVIKLTMVLDGAIAARELARFVGEVPVNASAEIEALVRLDMVDNWQPQAKVGIGYRWVRAPGVAVFGQRISLASAADPLVARLIAELEAAVPESLERLQPRERLAALWTQGFAVLPLNPGTPPVWLRLAPEQLYFDNYTITGDVLTLAIGARAVAQSFVGTEPKPLPATPLPPQAPVPPGTLAQFRLQVPIVADYAGLEQLVASELKTLEAGPMQVRGLGAVTASFGKVHIHETTGGRVAIGLDMAAGTPRQWLKPRGTVWMTVRPVLLPGTQQLDIGDVAITGNPDNASFRMLLSVARSRLVRDQIARALSRDFAAERDRALASAREALANRRVGEFRLTATIDAVDNGGLVVMGQGLALPVTAQGTARLSLDPVTP